MKKGIIIVLLVIITGCSSSKKLSGTKDIPSTKDASSRKDNPKASVNVYSGIKPVDDIYFNYPSSVIEYNGSLLITDSNNNLIRRIRDDQIENFVGNGTQNDIDGKYIDASLNKPNSIVTDSKNNIYVVTNYRQISKIDSLGNVTMFAGKYYRGSIDGPADAEIDSPKETAFFPHISALRIDEDDNIYVACGHLIRKISSNGNVTTITGKNKKGDKIGSADQAMFSQISDIVINDKGELLIVDQVNKKIKKLSTNGEVSTLIDKGIVKWPTSININKENEILVFDSNSKKLYYFNQSGKVLNIIIDPILKKERFHYKVKIYISKNDEVIIPSRDFINTLNSKGVISQIGTPKGTHQNGNLKKATYYIPYDGVFDKEGNLFVLDKGNILIRKISKSGEVSHVSGNGHHGVTNGKPNLSKFKKLNAITIDNMGYLYVLDGDFKNATIRKIDKVTGNTSTILNNEKKPFKWERPSDIVCDSKNNLFISDIKANVVYKIDSLGNIKTYLSNSDIKLKLPHGLHIDKKDNLFICDSQNNRIIKVSKNKEISIIQPKGIRLREPENITTDDFGNIYVTDSNRTRLVQIDTELNGKICIRESTLGKNKNRKLSEYYNTLKIESFKNSIYLFDKYDHQIIEFKNPVVKKH